MKIKINGIDDIFKELNNIDKQRTAEAIRKTTQKIYENVKFFAKPHYRTGTLERNIRHKIKNQAGIVWIDDADMMVDWRGKRVNYAIFVLYGTKPHYIVPKRKKSLRFTLDNFIFAKSVKHPGYKGNNFIKKAIQKTLQGLEKL